MSGTNKKPAPCLSVLGTGSDVGKSIVAAALCRIFSNAAYRVAPFKAQNMSNNSYVTAEGGEMGRAQVVQAECARIEPHVDMNPLLLKPTGDCKSQAVLQGSVVGELSSAEFRTERDRFYPRVCESLSRLRNDNDLIVMEGAGSCAEINLRECDIANFRIAKECGASVILVSDIDTGGVFAKIVGTLALLEPDELKLVKGIVVNRFRGDPALFDDGKRMLEEKTGLPLLGLIPYYRDIEIDAEDSVLLDKKIDPPDTVLPGRVNIGVVALPHISNFTDFSLLSREPSVNLSYLSRSRSLEGIDLVILPGTKNVRGDLEWLKNAGWHGTLERYVANGGRLGGICGGYQMLGRIIDDPHGVEGSTGSAEGLALLNISTALKRDKMLKKIRAKWLENNTSLTGYEIHVGETTLGDGVLPLTEIEGPEGATHYDGARSDNGRIWGCYLHGLFDSLSFRRGIIKSLAKGFKPTFADSGDADDFKQKQYDLLADHFRQHLDIPAIARLIGLELPADE